MPLANRRREYSWPKTMMENLRLIPQKRSYTSDENIVLEVGCRVIGGLREVFNPDVWTVAWEDFDKLLRMTMKFSVAEKRGSLLERSVIEPRKEVRRATFYWSRDPDLPYRIWPLIIPEDGGAPQVPTSVEDARVRMFDVVKRFEVPASKLGHGSHKLLANVSVGWGRHSYIEKGHLSAKSAPKALRVE